MITLCSTKLIDYNRSMEEFRAGVNDPKVLFSFPVWFWDLGPFCLKNR
jgi:hypothetical protein